MSYCDKCDRDVDDLEAHIAERHQCPYCEDIVDFVPAHIERHHQCRYCQAEVDDLYHHLMGCQPSSQTDNTKTNLIVDYFRSLEQRNQLGSPGDVEILALGEGFHDSKIGDNFNQLVEDGYLIKVKRDCFNQPKYKFVYDEICRICRERIPGSATTDSEEKQDEKNNDEEEMDEYFLSPERNLVDDPAMRNIDPPSSNQEQVL